MKIAINCAYFTPRSGGIREYIFNLVKHLELMTIHDELIYYITRDAEKELTKLIKTSSRVKIFPYAEKDKFRRSLFQQRFWTKEEQQERFDVFHSPFFHSPRFRYAKVILTVHDLRLLNYPASYTFARWVFLRFAVKRAIKNADQIIAISNFTKQEILKHFRAEESKIHVIHEAVDRNGFSLQIKDASLSVSNYLLLKDSFILAVGHLEPRKNYLRLIKAYQKLPDHLQKQYKLVIVGRKDHQYKKTLQAINTLPGVIYLDFVSRDELVWLYANCKFHVFPSFYEGFGFPVLEAGLFSKPTAASNQSSIPEILGKGGLYFDPFHVEEIYKSMQQLLTNEELFRELSQLAYENVFRFSWEQNVNKTYEVYQKVVATRKVDNYHSDGI